MIKLRLLFGVLAMCLCVGESAYVQKVAKADTEAQIPDAVTADTKHYAVEFENEYVRALRIHYGPHEQGNMHNHPHSTTVFLTDGKLKMTFPDGKSTVGVVKKGQVVWEQAGPHQPENLTETPFEAVRIELKTLNCAEDVPPVQSQKRKASMSQKGRIVGIGGIFFKSANQQQMKEWYAKHLGLADSGHGDVILPWREKDNPENERMTIWSIFPTNTKYFEPSSAPFMLNYIVDDLEALLNRLAKEGVQIDPKRQDESYGRFAWIYDPDGNKIELWQPLNPNK